MRCLVSATVALATICHFAAAQPASSPYAVLHATDFKTLLGSDYEWADGNIPLLDFPQADLNKVSA